MVRSFPSTDTRGDHAPPTVRALDGVSIPEPPIRPGEIDAVVLRMAETVFGCRHARLVWRSGSTREGLPRQHRWPTTPLLNRIHNLKRESTELRRSVWPLREVVNTLVRNDGNFFAASTLLYLRDVYDHLVHFIESLESIRDLLGGMLDIYLSSLSNRVNMELRALTVIAMLFMPATLIAGIFGMNFEHMPWLASEHGFWWVVGLMATVAISMGLMFWRRQWPGRL